MPTNPRIKTVERGTHRTWDEWLQFMDRIGAKNLSHPEIAAQAFHELEGKVDNPAWWAQSVTVEYERTIDRRLPGQRADGTFQTSISKATKLGMQALMDKWVDFAAGDKKVRAEVGGDVKVSGTEKRITWRTKAKDGSAIRITSEPKKDGAASLIVTLMDLETLERSDEAKSRWAKIVQRFTDGL